MMLLNNLQTAQENSTGKKKIRSSYRTLETCQYSGHSLDIEEWVAF